MFDIKYVTLIYKALKFAERKHDGQVRKISKEAYINHPIIVSYIAANFKKSKNLHHIIVAAILHDTIEDTATTYEEILSEFGPLVTSLVFELTDDPHQLACLGKVEYQKNKWCGLSNYGLFIKLCDRLSNVSDNPTEKYLKSTIEVLDHVQKKRKLTGSQKQVALAIRDRIHTSNLPG